MEVINLKEIKNINDLKIIVDFIINRDKIEHFIDNEKLKAVSVIDIPGFEERKEYLRSIRIGIAGYFMPFVREIFAAIYKEYTKRTFGMNKSVSLRTYEWYEEPKSSRTVQDSLDLHSEKISIETLYPFNEYVLRFRKYDLLIICNEDDFNDEARISDLTLETSVNENMQLKDLLCESCFSEDFRVINIESI